MTHEVLQYLVKRRFGRWSQMDARNSSLMGEVPAKAKPVPSAIATAATAEKAGARRGFSERPRGQSNSAPTNIGGGGEQDGQRQQCRPEQADPKEVPGVPARHRDQRLCCVLAVRGALKAAGWAVVLGVSLVSVVYLVQQVTGGG